MSSPARTRRVLAALLMFVLSAGAAVYAQTVPTVDDCREADYLDRSQPSADRTFNWTYSFAGDPERCITVRVGQSVQWQGNFGDHPLESDQGDRPNPIDGHANGLVRFDRPGIFGYRCNFHLEMRGAVRVLAADAALPVPSGSLLARAALALGLLCSGGILLGSARTRRASTA